MSPAGRTLLPVGFLLSSALLCACSVAFCVKWTRYDSSCGESQAVITVICGMSAVVYGAGTLASLVFLFFHLFRQCLHCNILLSILTIASGSLIFSVLSGTGMLISLYFGFDPSCLADEKSTAEFVCLWLLVVYAVISNAIFLFGATFVISREDIKKTSVSSNVSFIQPLPPLYQTT